MVCVRLCAFLTRACVRARALSRARVQKTAAGLQEEVMQLHQAFLYLQVCVCVCARARFVGAGAGVRAGAYLSVSACVP